VDLLQYFVPNYSGWQTAKRIWTYMNGGTNQFRFFKYSTSSYELIKSPDGTSTETFDVGLFGVYVTSEMGPVLNSSSRLFIGDGLYFLPGSICRNRPTFRMCHDGEQFINPTSCLPAGSTPAHCAIYLSRVEFAPNYNYGGSIGVLDSIIKVDKLDNAETEKYFYGRNRGLLRWEHYNSAGTLINWGQQTSEIPNSPIPHNSCVQP